MKYFVIITVFMVSMLTACITYDREILTFAKIAKDIETDREKAINTYVDKIVTIRAKIEDIAGLREHILEYFVFRFRGSDFVSFRVHYKRDEVIHLTDESFHIDAFFTQMETLTTQSSTFLECV